jgi:hypothetical protein
VTVMKLSFLLLALVACSPTPATPEPRPATPKCEPRLALDPLQRDAACLDSVESCLSEAQQIHLRDPLDRYTREQEEVVLSRGCLVKLRECRGGAWRP